ncbi:flavodoxin family protein [Desulfoscipio sp. XC116]|uniref:flavodoxin family protein n=1 Tax=Desulfoscipio sp. XC116 TaxID=3144975 RepID=UPI00325A6DB5
MKILGIVGSPRRNGNTSRLVKEVLQGAAKEGAITELVFLHDYKFTGCRGCEKCSESCRCVINDDMQKLYPLLLEADGLVLGSPTYFYNVSADMKKFIDRCYSMEVFAKDDRSCWVGISEAMGGKYAVALTVCEQHDEQYMGFTMEALTKPLVDLGYRVIDTVKAVGFLKPGEVSENAGILDKSVTAGKRLAKTIKLRKELETKLRSGTVGPPFDRNQQFAAKL